jgi:hypothetical protein
MLGHDRLRRAPEGVVVLLGLAAVAASQFATVRCTNFGGVDEWLYLSLNSQGIVALPHSNRPLTLIWSLPAVLLTPGRFQGYLVMHVLYLVLGAWLTWLLVRWLEPGDRFLAFLAATFCLVWAPLDMARLAVVQTSMNSGATFGTLLAIALFVHSWRRRRVVGLGLGMAVAVLAARTYEATLGLLAGAPLLLAVATPGQPEGKPDARRVRWSLAWEAAVVLSGALAAAPLLKGSAGTLYQTAVLGADLDPGRWLARLAKLYYLHLGPLVVVDVLELLRLGVVVAVVVFLGAAEVAGRRRGGSACSPRRLLGLAALGLALAGMGYAILAASPAVVNATRTQFLSAPGAGLFIAAMLCLLGSLVPARARRLTVLALAAVVVALGTGHTLAMQRQWNRVSAYPAQRAALATLVREAPSLRANTLLLLIDDDHAFPYSFTFRHAVALVYGNGVVGHALGDDSLLYTLSADRAGVRVTPWPVIQGPWREHPTFHRADEVVVFRLSKGRLRLVEDWGETRLPSVAAGARYVPRERIGGPPASPPVGRRALD